MLCAVLWAVSCAAVLCSVLCCASVLCAVLCVCALCLTGWSDYENMIKSPHTKFLWKNDASERNRLPTRNLELKTEHCVCVCVCRSVFCGALENSRELLSKLKSSNRGNYPMEYSRRKDKYFKIWIRFNSSKGSLKSQWGKSKRKTQVDRRDYRPTTSVSTQRGTLMKNKSIPK
jgi:hypothetical protein